MFNKSGQPLAPGKPKLTHLDEIEKEMGNLLTLYAHGITRGHGNKVTITPSPTPVVWVCTGEATSEFSTDNLGPYIPSREDVSGAVPKLTGFVRPVFEVIPTQPQQVTTGTAGVSTVLQPNMKSKTCLTLYTIEKLELKAKQYMLL